LKKKFKEWNRRSREKKKFVEKKEEDRIKKENDKKIRDQILRQKSQEIKEKQEEERRKMKEKREIEAKQRFEKLISFEVTDCANYLGEVDDYENEEEENEKDMKEKKLKIEKLKAKKLKKEKKKAQRKEFLSQKRALLQEKKQKILEEKKRKAEEDAQIKAEKELRRTEYAARKEKKLKKLFEENRVEAKPSDDERKIFVGGISFKDLENTRKYPIKFDSITEKEIKFRRIKYYFEIFEQFGEIEKKKDYIISKSHCFIVYKTKQSFQEALKTLSKYEEREKLTKVFKEKLVAEGGKDKKVFAPVPHFYVRPVNALKKKKSVL